MDLVRCHSNEQISSSDHCMQKNRATKAAKGNESHKNTNIDIWPTIHLWRHLDTHDFFEYPWLRQDSKYLPKVHHLISQPEVSFSISSISMIFSPPSLWIFWLLPHWFSFSSSFSFLVVLSWFALMRRTRDQTRWHSYRSMGCRLRQRRVTEGGGACIRGKKKNVNTSMNPFVFFWVLMLFVNEWIVIFITETRFVLLRRFVWHEISTIARDPRCSGEPAKHGSFGEREENWRENRWRMKKTQWKRQKKSLLPKSKKGMPAEPKGYSCFLS